MRDCINHHRRYMSLMTASKDTHLPAAMRRGLISEAYKWLNAWFDAVERELERNYRIAR